jgi:hypothetical protein
VSGTDAGYVCGLCGTEGLGSEACPNCGASEMLVWVKDGCLAEFPAGGIPCPLCGTLDRPLVFRGWSRLVAFLWWAREHRSSAYVCAPCARAETTKVLFLNALLGWWSVPSLLFYGWRVTYLNWRAVWAPPPNPGRWGAIPAADFAADLRNARAQALGGAPQQWLREDTPLAKLTETQLALVLEADGLYELIGVQVGADIETIRKAYRSRSKDWHPDLSQEASREATENMIRLNQAWEILRSPEMRQAYDWLIMQRQTESVV